ncbi:phosphotransferase enzyme family protein [Alkalicoccobacillus gibsonii]|uniref:phosphotransferase enzyme family protein n=1 Tax=Alkalicoccobacillus gibsonii TaxID=79881 RepID=UPI003F7B5057
MLKLKFLFDNEELAKMLLANWSLPNLDLDLFKYYRISSNAIYPFQNDGQTQFLRYSPQEEKCKDQILAELDYISFLRAKKFGVLEASVSKGKQKLVSVETPWGSYYASVFKRVDGVQLDKAEASDGVIFSYGKALGKLHRLSSDYDPPNFKRWTYYDVFNWIEQTLEKFPREKAAQHETALLRSFFNTISITEKNFGLIHYDFEYDNIFYDESTNTCNVIDFDDCMYHLYVMDVEKALESMTDYIPTDQVQHKRNCFLDGYRSEFEIENDMLQLMPLCRRFASLYGYVRVIRATDEKWNHEPQWMDDLRINLSIFLKSTASGFGKAL